MNVLIAADMEGIAGIEDCGDCLPSHPSAYAAGRRLMTDEVLVTVEALRAAAAPLPGGAEDRRRGRELARTTVDEPGDLLTAIADVFRSSQVSREYRQLAKLLPAGHDSRARVPQRRLGSLVATPVMRSKERRWLASAPRA